MNKTKIKNQLAKQHKRILLAAYGLSILSVLTILVSIGGLYLSDKLFRTQIGDELIAVKNQDQTVSSIAKMQLPEEIIIDVLTPTEKQTFSLKTSDIDANIDPLQTFQKAKNSQSLGDFINPQKVLPVINYDEEKLDEFLSLIAGQLYIPPVYPDVAVNGTSVTVTRGSVGYQVDILDIKNEITKRLKSFSSTPLAFTMSPVGQVLGDSDEKTINETNSKLLGKTIELTFEDFSQTIYQEEILELISNISGSDVAPIQKLINLVANNIETPPSNPVFKQENNRVIEFSPAVDGIKINDQKLKSDLESAFSELLNTEIDSVVVEIAVTKSEPELSIEDVNQFGISELIGRGSSAFRGSIPNRVHNVALAAEKISGTLVAPGETFSFNETVGDISVYTGFKQSYVIQGNETVLGDGGGVCQVSTTLFRAALNSGLPIAERRPHSYRVSYYEQGAPLGLDATIYSPSVDFKFTNDTEAYILIQAFVDTRKMTLEFELYGKSDGREVVLTDPIITSQSPAPEPLYVDDPTKPAGYLEQIDWAAGGARVEYDYIVTRDGEELINKKFYSNYRPWQAKYIRGTGPTQ